MKYQMETEPRNISMLIVSYNEYIFGVIEKIKLCIILNRFRQIIAKTVNENETDFKVLYVC